MNGDAKIPSRFGWQLFDQKSFWSVIVIPNKPPACNSLHFVSFKHAVPYPKTGVPPDYGVYGTVPCPSHENGYENKKDFFETQNEKIYEMKHGMTNGNHQNGIVQYKNLMTRNALVQTVGRVQNWPW